MNTQKLLTNWRRFIRNGFRYADFSDDLYQHLIVSGGFAEVAHGYNYTADESSKYAFWSSYFDEGFSWLVSVIDQFGGSLGAVEGFDAEWIDLDPVNRALIEEMQLIYPALVEVLLEREDDIYDDYKAYNLANMEAEDGGWTAEQRAAASQAYARDFYYYGGQEIFDYDGVDDELRDRLAQAVADHIAPNTAATLFEAIRIRPATFPVPQPAQETLFTARRTHRFDRRRLAATARHPSTTAVPERAVPTVTPDAVAQYKTMRASL